MEQQKQKKGKIKSPDDEGRDKSQENKVSKDAPELRGNHYYLQKYEKTVNERPERTRTEFHLKSLRWWSPGKPREIDDFEKVSNSTEKQDFQLIGAQEGQNVKKVRRNVS